ncbi:MarR family winged helix-turn-helix transcriptional regulator [Microlunatus sp. Y2014]|uniref:MarR family winged helix-turn-helix transcriptional regulator n=1 Tax=Microlunatus sp. Y2014 TaxID=3418488 RepID=UPI003DA77777
MGDRLDVILEQWAAARPDLDTAPMGVIGRISRASSLLAQRLDTVFAEHNLQRGEFDILATLRRAAGPNGMSAGALASVSMVTSGAITNRVDHLVAKGLVTRDLDPANRRSTLIALTPSGRQLIDSILPDHVANEVDILSALSPKQQAKLADLLRRLLIGLDDTSEAEQLPPS